jgi:hypothetical protein
MVFPLQRVIILMVACIAQMIDSQKQVEELSTRLAAVLHEKNKLESRNNVLEKVCIPGLKYSLGCAS